MPICAIYEFSIACHKVNKCKYYTLYRQLKDRLKYKQALDEIEKYLDAQQKYFDGEDYHNLLDIINKAKEEINEES